MSIVPDETRDVEHNIFSIANEYCIANGLTSVRQQQLDPCIWMQKLSHTHTHARAQALAHGSVGPMCIEKHLGQIYPYCIETIHIIGHRSDCTCRHALAVRAVSSLCASHVEWIPIDFVTERWAWCSMRLHSTSSNKSKWLLFKAKFTFEPEYLMQLYTVYTSRFDFHVRLCWRTWWHATCKLFIHPVCVLHDFVSVPFVCVHSMCSAILKRVSECVCVCSWRMEAHSSIPFLI